MTDYQIFISYRRDGGEDLAGRISDKLKGLGYRVFYDVESMRSGTFNTQIYAAIEACEDVLLILPPRGLDRCKDADDWVRLEVEHSIRCGKNIIPVMMRGFEFPADLPQSIAKVCDYEGVKVYAEYFSAVIDRVEALLHSQRPGVRPAPSGPESDISSGVRFINYGLYPQAIACFEKAMQSDLSNPDVYFYGAAALLQGKRPFLVDRPTIKKVEEYLNVAIAIGDKALYHYFLAYVKFDHHHSKMLRTVPSYQEVLFTAQQLGVTQEETEALFKLLRTQRPVGF